MSGLLGCVRAVVFWFDVVTDHEMSEMDEFRRLLFVAMTRAQGLLYLSHCHNRMAGGTNKRTRTKPYFFFWL